MDYIEKKNRKDNAMNAAILTWQNPKSQEAQKLNSALYHLHHKFIH